MSCEPIKKIDSPRAFYLWVENAVVDAPIPPIADDLLAELLSTYFKTTFLTKFTLARSQLAVRRLVHASGVGGGNGASEEPLTAEDLASSKHTVWVAECPDRSGKIAAIVTAAASSAETKHTIEVPRDEGEDEAAASSTAGDAQPQSATAAASLCFQVSLDLDHLVRSRKASAQTRRVSLLRQHMADYALQCQRQEGAQFCRCPFDPLHIVDMATLKEHLATVHLDDCLAVVADFALYPPRKAQEEQGQVATTVGAEKGAATADAAARRRRRRHSSDRRPKRVSRKRGRERSEDTSSNSSSESSSSSSSSPSSSGDSSYASLSWSSTGSRKASTRVSSEDSFRPTKTTKDTAQQPQPQQQQLQDGSASLLPPGYGAAMLMAPQAAAAAMPAQPAAGVKSVHVGGHKPLDESLLRQFLFRHFGPSGVVAVHNVPAKNCAFVELLTEDMAVAAVRMWHSGSVAAITGSAPPAVLDDGSRVRVNWAKYNVSALNQTGGRSGVVPPPPPPSSQVDGVAEHQNQPGHHRAPPPSYPTAPSSTLPSNAMGQQQHFTQSVATSAAVQRSNQTSSTAVLHLSSSEVSERSVFLEASQYGNVTSVTMLPLWLRALVVFDTSDAVQMLVHNCSSSSGGAGRVGSGCFQTAAEGMVC